MIKVGMVGLGGWGKNVARSFGSASNCELAYLCDSSDASLDQHRRLYPRATATREYRQLLDCGDLDAVALATPAPAHHEMARAALRAGKHVFVEKPMALTAEHAQDLVETADRAGKLLMVGHLLEYHPAVEYIKEQIDRGAIGEVYYVYSQRLNLGVVRADENAFWSLAPHDVSVVLYLFGQEPDRVTAAGECYLQPGIQDVVFANLHFPDGRAAQIHVSWLDPNKERKIVVVGSRKMIVFDDMQASEKIRVFDKGIDRTAAAGGFVQAIQVRHGDIQIPYIPAQEPLQLEVQHFVDCVHSGETPRSDGRDGLRVVRVLERVERELRALPGTRA